MTTTATTGLVQVKLKDIRPNPFRRIDRYPIRRDKVEALKDSIRTTGFWNNLNGRRNDKGDVEIAYGHHRLAALKELYSPEHEIGVLLRDLSNEEMLRMMASENMEEWGANAAVHFETVRAVVQAHADGAITLAAPHIQMRKSEIRYAPSLVPAGDQGPLEGRDRPYTLASIGKFLGWLKPTGKVQDKLLSIAGGLELIELGVVEESEISSLTVYELRLRLPELRRKHRAKLAAVTHRELARKAEDEANKTQAPVKQRALLTQAAAERRIAQDLENPRTATSPDINDFAPKLAGKLGDILEDNDVRVQHLRQVIQYKDHLEQPIRDDIANTLREIAKRATALAEELEQPPVEAARRLELVSGKAMGS